MAPEATNDTAWVTVGRIKRPWGVRGHVMIDVLSDVPNRFAQGESLFIDGEPFSIEQASPHNDTMILKLEGVDSLEEAAALRGRLLTVPSDSLPPLPKGTYYHHHLIDMAVYARDGRFLGKLTDIISTGGNDVYVVTLEGKEFLLPALDDVILEVDVDKGRMTVELLPGLEQ